VVLYGAILPAPGFHHLHLNSPDPDTAIDFYIRQFPRSAKSSWGGLPALAAPNDVLVLFTRVAAAPATSPQTAIRHFGWHVTDTHASLESARDDFHQPHAVKPTLQASDSSSVLRPSFVR
jgi:catechol 2,3-dioxygenase-like lactoylglutathione lyase family enzyme